MENNIWFLVIGAGFGGGLITLFLQFILDRAAKKDELHYQEKLKIESEKLNQLRRILGEIIPFTENGIEKKWIIPDEPHDVITEKRRNYREQISLLLTFFLPERDFEIYEALSFLRVILFKAGELEEPASKEWEEAGRPLVFASHSLFTQALPFINYQIYSSLLPQIKAAIEKKISKTEKLLQE
ncbi:hypothetical protein KQH54_03665 [bacterium]|nr:hypothetical protein [bacterium]